MATFHNDFTDGICLKAIQLIFKYLPRAYADGGDEEAREHMANAATIGRTWLHQFVGVVGACDGPLFRRYISKCRMVAASAFSCRTRWNTWPGLVRSTRFRDIAHALRLPVGDERRSASAAAVIAAIRALQQLGQPRTVAEMGVERDAYDSLVVHLCEFGEGDGTFISGVRIPERDDLIRCSSPRTTARRSISNSIQ